MFDMTRRARRNPLMEHRGGAAPGVTEYPDDVDSWRNAVASALRFDGFGAFGKFIHVRSTGVSGFAGAESGEISVYVVGDANRVANETGFSAADPSMVEDLAAYAEWVKENATFIIRGEVDGFDGGYHDVLRSFVAQAHGGLAFSTPVFIQDPTHPDGYFTTLNAAMLTAPEREVYDLIMAAAQWLRSYEETNEDVVSDFPTAYIGERYSAERVIRGEMYSAGPNGHGWAPQSYTKKNRAGGKLKEFAALVAEKYPRRIDPETGRSRLPRNMNAQDQLIDVVRDAIRSSDIWCMSAPRPGEPGHDPSKWRRSDKGPNTPDQEKDLIVMVYETEDMVEEQLPDDVVDLAGHLSGDGLVHVVQALDRVDVRWEVEDARDNILVGDVNAVWWFTINVDSIIEEMCGEYQDLCMDEDGDEDGDDGEGEPEENPAALMDVDELWENNKDKEWMTQSGHTFSPDDVVKGEKFDLDDEEDQYHDASFKYWADHMDGGNGGTATCQALAVDDDGHVVDGLHRLTIAKIQGVKKIPVRPPNNLD